MRQNPVSHRRRGGVTLVECTFVLSIFLMFLFAIFEYSRLLMLLHVSNNAARSGARHATVNTDKGGAFVYADSGSTESIEKHVKNQMGGADTMIHDFAVTCFPCDTAQLYADPPVLTPKTGSPPWNQATFTERIAVRITGKYRPVLPFVVFFYSNTDFVPIQVTAAAGSEG